jgi:peroxiredoxin
LADFQAHLGELKENDIGVIALSVDAEDKTRDTVEQHGLQFPVAWGLTTADAERIGAAWEGQRNFMQPAQFILNPRNEIMHTAYGEGPLGRIQAADVVKWVAFQRSRA